MSRLINYLGTSRGHFERADLYNQRPSWLDNAHKALDQAVAAAYGWEDYTEALHDAEILSRLLALNLERAG